MSQGMTDNEQYTPTSLSALIDTWKEAVRGEADDDLIRVPVADMRAMLDALAAHRVTLEAKSREALEDGIRDVAEYIPGSHAEDHINPAKAADHLLASGVVSVTEPVQDEVWEYKATWRHRDGWPTTGSRMNGTRSLEAMQAEVARGFGSEWDEGVISRRRAPGEWEPMPKTDQEDAS